MKLSTVVALPVYPFRIGHGSRVLLSGSCFAQEMGGMLRRHLFPVCVNPFGVSYNPLSVLGGLRRLLENRPYTEGELLERNGRWFSFDHDGSFSHPDKVRALEGIQQRFESGRDFLMSSPLLVLTWGTSWVYRHGSSGMLVNNCHKIPAGEFERSRLNPDEIVSAYDAFLADIGKVRPDLRVLLSISPVRHLKDGAHGNQVSKAVLLLAAGELAARHPDRVFYFPSHEIVLDELRDYRFYDEDLVHPSPLATRIIWDRLEESLMEEGTRQINRDVEALRKFLEHRPLGRDPESRAGLQMEKDRKIREMKQRHPGLSWENLDLNRENLDQSFFV